MESAGNDLRLLRIALEATRHLDAAGCFQAIAQGALDLLGGTFVLAYRVSPSGDDLECIAAAGATDPQPVAQALELLDAGLVWHLAPGAPAPLRNAQVLFPPGTAPNGVPPLGEGLLVPLVSGAGPVGLLLVLAAAGGSLHHDGEERARALVHEITPALDNLRVVASLRDLVIRDDTADCFNRRYLDHTLEDEVERARRFNDPLAVVFVDMDNLKDINTRHGHAAGSRVLYEASLRIGESIRSIDRLFRYGGDEFVVLLPGTTLKGAREAAERLRRALARAPIELPSGATAELTASAGVAAWPDHGRTGRALIEAADSAMRDVKAAGKNAVGVAAPIPGLTPPGVAEGPATDPKGPDHG